MQLMCPSPFGLQFFFNSHMQYQQQQNIEIQKYSDCVIGSKNRYVGCIGFMSIAIHCFFLSRLSQKKMSHAYKWKTEYIFIVCRMCIPCITPYILKLYTSKIYFECTIHHFKLAQYVFIYLRDVHSKMIIIKSTNRIAVFCLFASSPSSFSLSLFYSLVFINSRWCAFSFPLPLLHPHHLLLVVTLFLFFFPCSFFFHCDAINLLRCLGISFDIFYSCIVAVESLICSFVHSVKWWFKWVHRIIYRMVII